MKFPNLPFLEPYRARWQTLEPRERKLLIVAGVSLGIFLFYLLIWAPMQAALTGLRVNVPANEAKLMQMRIMAQQVNLLRASGNASRAQGGSILSTLEQTANARGLKQHITRLEPEGATGAQLQLDAIPFNSLVTWLNDLQVQNGLRVESATLETQTAPGVVKARLLLRAPAA